MTGNINNSAAELIGHWNISLSVPPQCFTNTCTNFNRIALVIGGSELSVAVLLFLVQDIVLQPSAIVSSLKVRTFKRFMAILNFCPNASNRSM